MPEQDNWKEELKKLLDNSRTGLKDSSDTNKTRYAILALFEDSLSSQAHALKKQIVEKIRGSIVIMSKENPTFLKQDGVSYDFEKNDGRRYGLQEVLDLLSAIESIEI